MLDPSSRSIKKILRNILISDASPSWAIFSVILLGTALAYSTITDPESTSIVILVLTLLLSSYIAFLVYLVKNKQIRFSDLVGIPNYPYQTLISEQTWYLENPEGTEARFEKKKVIKVLESLSYISEYGWGDAKIPSIQDINTGNGKHFPMKIFEQGSRYVIEIKLDRTYNPGEEISLFYTKRLKDAFTNKKEWVEIITTTNVGQAIMSVVFPPERPFTKAVGIHRHGDYVAETPLNQDLFISSESPEGRNFLRWTIPNPVPRDVYTIEWEW